MSESAEPAVQEAIFAETAQGRRNRRLENVAKGVFLTMAAHVAAL